MDKIFKATPGEHYITFLMRIEKLRLKGETFQAVYNDIIFEVNPDISVYDSFEEAYQKFKLEQKELKDIEKKEKSKLLDKMITTFLTKSNLSSTEVIQFIGELSEKEVFPGKEALNSLFTFLSNLGYTSVSSDMCYKTDSLLQTIPGYKGYRVYNADVFFPENIDFFNLNLEQVTTYIIGNFMSQIKDGIIDPSNSDLVIYVQEQLLKKNLISK